MSSATRRRLQPTGPRNHPRRLLKVAATVFVLASHFHQPNRPGRSEPAGKPPQEDSPSLEASLRRLQTDHIDTVLVPRPCPPHPSRLFVPCNDQFPPRKGPPTPAVVDWCMRSRSQPAARLLMVTVHRGPLRYNRLDRFPERNCSQADAFGPALFAWAPCRRTLTGNTSSATPARVNQVERPYPWVGTTTSSARSSASSPRNRLLTRAGCHFLCAAHPRGSPADRGTAPITFSAKPRAHRRAPQPSSTGPPERTQSAHAPGSPRMSCGRPPRRAGSWRPTPDIDDPRAQAAPHTTAPSPQLGQASTGAPAATASLFLARHFSSASGAVGL